jgi:hypothetical protein
MSRPTRFNDAQRHEPGAAKDRVSERGANHFAPIRAFDVRFRRREARRARFVQKNFRRVRIRGERRLAIALRARSARAKGCALDRAQRDDHQEMPIPWALITSGKFRRDIGERAHGFLARMRSHRDERVATPRERVVIVHTSSMRFGFFRLLRY